MKVRSCDNHMVLKKLLPPFLDGSDVVGLCTPVYSLTSLLSTSSSKTSVTVTTTRQEKKTLPYSNHQRGRQALKGRQALVRDDSDGFFYPGTGIHIIISQMCSSHGCSLLSHLTPLGVVVRNDRNTVSVELVDKQVLTSPLTDVILTGGARPCPQLRLTDHVLVRVRTYQGPHPSKINGSCDFYVPGVVLSLPESTRTGHLLYSVLVYNRKSVTCSRQGIVKIGEHKYSEMCDFIKTCSKPRDLASKVSHHPSPSSSSSSSSRSSLHTFSRTSIHIPMGSSPYHTSSPVHSCPVSSRRSSAKSRQSHSSSSRKGGERGRGGGLSEVQKSSEAPPQSSEEILWLLEQHKNQREELEQQKRDLSSLQVRQQELEREVQAKRLQDLETQLQSKKEEELRTRLEELEKNLQRRKERGVEEEEAPATPQAVTGGGSIPVRTAWIAGYLPMSGGGQSAVPPSLQEVEVVDGPVSASEQGVNTEAWTEERGTVTDPMMESRGVGTEWSQSEVETESETTEMSHPSLTPISSNLSPSLVHSLSPSPASQTEADKLSIEAENDPFVAQHVLARWPDDGWYYRAEVLRPVGQMWYQVKDASQDVETIHAQDILTDLKDSQEPLQTGDTVAALHPYYDYSYAPGKVSGVTSDGFHFSVKLYDGVENFLPRQEIYHIAQGKYLKDVEYLKEREAAWVGKAVIARRDKDGLFLPG